MPRIDYTVAGEYFPTQRDLVARIQELLRSYRAPVCLDGADAALMADLLERHPSAERKIGCGVAAIWIKKNGVFGQGFYVERTDGTFEDFSYKQCIRPFTHATKAKFAFRRAIDDQVIAVKERFFAQHPTATCPILGHDIDWSTAHVDHIPPKTFAALLAQYCAERGIDLDTIPLLDPPRGIGKVLPPAIAADWAVWHAARAELRVISAEANITIVR